MVSLLLLAGMGAKNAHCATVHTAAAVKNNQLQCSSSNDDSLEAITYHSVASVVEQCDFNSSGSNLNVSFVTFNTRRKCRFRLIITKIGQPFPQLSYSGQYRILVENPCKRVSQVLLLKRTRLSLWLALSWHQICRWR